MLSSFERTKPFPFGNNTYNLLNPLKNITNTISNATVNHKIIKCTIIDSLVFF